mmetsp:Transcript_7637/g.34636  ORF Transcript_7637/g.34636 Transcript_7637/m.34636 type:complete len:297 (-) Transcript_7637:180-1070(-)
MLSNRQNIKRATISTVCFLTAFVIAFLALFQIPEHLHPKPFGKRVGREILRDGLVPDSEAFQALIQFANLVHNQVTPTCSVVPYGVKGRQSYGRHDLCRRQYAAPCIAISFGIEQDYTFELDIRNRHGCTVFALDPTVNHRASLADGVYFLNWGAPSNTSAAWLGSQSGWVFVSPVNLAKLVAPEEIISILKMDCEGCEYKLYEYVARHDPWFFHRVDQFAVEVHLSRTLGMASDDDALAWGKLLVLLERAGHRLQNSVIDHCSPADEASGTLQIVRDIGYSTGFDLCHNYLFAKV